MASVAVVLGAGGVTGAAYHAGALAAIAAVTGFDARRAGLLIGTSAGAGIAGLLRAGLAPADLYARVEDRPLSAEGTALLADLPEGNVELPPRPTFGPWLVPQAPWLLAPAFLSRGGPRPGLALAGALPRGPIDSEMLGERLRTLVGDRWPEQPVWICAVRTRDGKRVVFGRDDVETPDLGTAVQASSAVPGFFTPVRVGGRSYLDGGAWSASNADLVAGLGFDLAVVVSPMSAVPSALRPGRDISGRTLHARVLAREVGRVRSGVTKVLTVQPTSDSITAMGRNALDAVRAPAVAEQAFDEVSRLLERDAVAERVEVLSAATA